MSAKSEKLNQPLVIRFINAPSLLVGVFIGFLFCVIQGHVVSQEDYVRHFKRFNAFIGPETQFYPSIRLMRALATNRYNQPTSKGAVLVIIGGSSVMNGCCQGVDDLWSEHLETQLGGHFRVVNLAMRGCSPTAGAECVAEYFYKKGIPVIYVADTVMGTDPDGGATYRYQYWQAYEAGFLLPNPDRVKSASIDSGINPIHAGLNEYLRFDDGWNCFSYCYATTFWPGMPYQEWWYPKQWLYTDHDDDQTSVVPPVPDRFQPFLAATLSSVRTFSAHFYELDGQGHWQVNDPHFKEIEKTYTTAFVPEMRSRTLFIRDQCAPYYRSLFTPMEQECDRLTLPETLRRLSNLGFTVATDDGFDNADYHDGIHLCPSGGNKLAELIAPKILDMAHRLYGTDLTPAPMPKPSD